MYDYRTLLEELEDQDQIIKISHPTDTVHELSAIQWNIEKTHLQPVLFENVKNYKTKVIGNLYMMPFRMGITPIIPMTSEFRTFYNSSKKPGILYPIWESNELFIQLFKELETIFLNGYDYPVKPKFTDECLFEHNITEDIDILKLIPIPKYFREDAGHYITCGITIARDPETSYLNSGVYRIQVIDKDKLAIMADVKSDLRQIIIKALEKNKKIQVAIAVGVRPEILHASCMRTSYGLSEIDIAGGLIESPVILTHGLTVDVDIPYDAEIVIEGEIDPTKKVVEGPFTEYGFIASRSSNSYMIKIKAIRFRDEPVYHSLVVSSMEMTALLIATGVTEIMQSKKLLSQITSCVKNIWALPGIPSAGMAVSIDKTNDAQPRDIMMALFSRSPQLKRIVVVDEEINIYDPTEVQWAIDSRVCNEGDIFVTKGSGSIPDTARIDDFTLKIGFDATKKKGILTNFNRSTFEDINMEGILKNI